LGLAAAKVRRYRRLERYALRFKPSAGVMVGDGDDFEAIPAHAAVDLPRRVIARLQPAIDELKMVMRLVFVALLADVRRMLRRPWPAAVEIAAPAALRDPLALRLNC
jgi:hypothetical protein